MTNKLEKPSPEAKALSLYLMAFKSTSNVHKEKSKRMNKQWGLVVNDERELNDYLEEVNVMLESFGGYEEVIEKTVRHYVGKTGEWKLQGDDKYAVDTRLIADKISNEK